MVASGARDRPFLRKDVSAKLLIDVRRQIYGSQLKRWDLTVVHPYWILDFPD
jgi:hypothetical protein